MRDARPPIPPAKEGGPRRTRGCEPRRDPSAHRGAAAAAAAAGRAGAAEAAVESVERPARSPRRKQAPEGTAGSALIGAWRPQPPTPEEGCELKLPAFRAHSPLLKSRRFFVDILTLLSSHCQLCPAARHLAVYLLDHFLDRYTIPTSKQLYTVAVSCLLLASKFEDREDHVPKLEQINSTRILSGQNFTLTKKELLNTELLLLEAFSWNLCLPTPAHFLDYYLLASVSQKDHHCHSWPTACPRKTKECLKEYAHYFLEVTLQGGVPLSLPHRGMSTHGVLLTGAHPPRALPCHRGYRTGNRSPNLLPVLRNRRIAASVPAAGVLQTYSSPANLSYGR
uniref:Cyclin J like n=1 Tax=Ailuropoda melanoleuca TaxID=9646 RepID=A0A7N5JRK1_AILME